MSELVTWTVDTGALREKIARFTGQLTRQGGDMCVIVKQESGLLAQEIANQLGPHDTADARARVKKDVSGFLTDKPKFSNLDQDQQYSSTADFTWLSAGKGFLLGINDEDNQMQVGTDDALKMYYAGRNSSPRGKAYEELGSRGHQSVLRLNRTRVKSSTLAAVQRAIQGRMGQSKAAFAATCIKFIPAARIPQWVRNKIDEATAAGKVVLDDAGMANGASPEVTFGSRAPGVASNPVMLAEIDRAIAKRQYAIQAKCDRLAKGWAINWKTGGVYKPEIETL